MGLWVCCCGGGRRSRAGRFQGAGKNGPAERLLHLGGQVKLGHLRQVVLERRSFVLLVFVVPLLQLVKVDGNAVLVLPLQASLEGRGTVGPLQHAGTCQGEKKRKQKLVFRSDSSHYVLFPLRYTFIY